jgi:hypothetical protein
MHLFCLLFGRAGCWKPALFLGEKGLRNSLAVVVGPNFGI